MATFLNLPLELRQEIYTYLPVALERRVLGNYRPVTAISTSLCHLAINRQTLTEACFILDRVAYYSLHIPLPPFPSTLPSPQEICDALAPRLHEYLELVLADTRPWRSTIQLFFKIGVMLRSDFFRGYREDWSSYSISCWRAIVLRF